MGTPLQCKYQQLQSTLLETIANFRCGRDVSGLDTFLNIVENVEDIIQTSIFLNELGFAKVLLPVAHALYDAVCNEDVTCVTDILEYLFLPYAENALKGVTEA